MAPKKITSRSAPRDDFEGRWRKALDRRAAMERELAAGAADPALLLAVQGVIAACDALTIFHRGESAASERHEDALELFNRLVQLPGLKEASGHLVRVLRAKGEVEYTGKTQKPQEVAALVDHARRFFEFAGKHLPATWK